MSEKIATREAYGQTLAELAATDKNLVVLDADLSKSTKTCDFAKVCPERFVDVGIAEQNMVSISAGLATLGKHVFCSSFAIFAVGRAFEQIRNSIAYPQLPVTIAAPHAGLTVGEDGATHQAIEDVAIMRAVPNMTVIVPADATETAQAVRLLAEHPGPAYLRLGRLAVEQVLPADYQFQIGKGTVLYNGDGEPEQVVIFACGLMLGKALEAARALDAEGIKAAVVNMPTIKPLDTELVCQMAKRCGAAVTVEEHSVIGGLGSAVCDALSAKLPTKVKKLGMQDVFGESGSAAALVQKYGLDAEGVYKSVKEFL